MPVKSLLSVGSLMCLLAACQGYEVSVNERNVYSPLPLFTDFHVTDTNLQQCIDQHIEDKHITRAIQLEVLVCSHAGIRSLDGLEQFAGIKELDLSDNALSSVTAVSGMSRLTRLSLSNNQISSAAPLLPLLRLTDADLSGNPDLECADLTQLRSAQTIQLKAPMHCRTNR